MKDEKPTSVIKHTNLTDTDPYLFPPLLTSHSPNATNYDIPPCITTSLLYVRVQDKTKTSPKDDVILSKGGIPTGYYVALNLKMPSTHQQLSPTLPLTPSVVVFGVLFKENMDRILECPPTLFLLLSQMKCSSV